MSSLLDETECKWLTRSERRLSFDNIPPELISLIFDQMEDFHNAFSFGLTCTFVWMCGERRIQQLYAISRAPWIGQRLICLGDYVQDFPQDFVIPLISKR